MMGKFRFALPRPFDLAERAAGRKKAFGAKRAAFETGQPHADHRRLDNWADIETILLGDAGMGDAISAIEGAFQLRVSLVIGERVAAGYQNSTTLSKPSRVSP